MFKKNSTKRGESLIETLIAITIVITALSAIMALFSSSNQTNQTTKERVIALNLAREGIEAVRYIRDTNWLNYSNNRRLCWNYWPDGEACAEGTISGINNNPLSGKYNINLNTTDFTWSITQDTDDIDLDNALYLKDSFYVTETAGTGSTTPFLRQIQISYPDGATDASKDNRMQVVSIVKWSTHEIKLETILTDFLERTEHAS